MKNLLFLLSTFYFLLSIAVAPVMAQTNNCCVSTVDNSCRVETTDEPCNTQVQTSSDCITGFSSPGLCCVRIGTDDSGQPECEEYRSVISGSTESRVACNSRQACIDAVNATAACEQIREQLLCQSSTANCFWFGNTCYNRNDHQICSNITDPSYCGPDPATGATRGSQACRWENGHCISRVESEISAQYKRQGGFLPACAYAGNCRSITDFLAVLISIAKEAFKYIGSIAFLFFVYGGITIVLSFGNADKVQKGKQILVAAIVGILISFSAFILVDFLLDTLFVDQFIRAV